MKKLLLLLVILFLLPALNLSVVKAQEKEKEISLAYGPYAQTTLDQQASPLLYKTHNANTAAFTYTRRTGKSRFGLKVNPAWGSYAPARFKSRVFGDDEHIYAITPTLYSLNLKVNYLRKLKTPGTAENLQFFIGSEISNSLLISDQIANTYWGNNILGLQVATQVEWRPAVSHKITGLLSVPALAVVSRANYANFPKSTNGSNFREFFRQGSELITVSKLQQVNLEAKYSFRLTRRFEIGGYYQFSWFHYPDPRPVYSFTQALLLQSSYHFKFR
jgi:hypothetical protein